MFENLTGTHKPDILDCISNLSSDEVFTPPEVVNQVLDLLPEDVWTNPDLKWLDPACKSGVFLREVAKRLLVGLQNAIPDEDERREHIFKNMLYGIAITELTGLISRRSLYYSKDASCEHSVIELDTADGNVHYSRGEHRYVGKKCIVCGAPEGSLDRGEHLENYAYQFLHKKNIEDFFDMKFDVIIGNPPYQLQSAGTSNVATPVYHHFVNKAKKLEPRYISMIIPSRWFAGGVGLDKFRDEMTSDSQIRELVDFSDSNEIFPGVDIAGGVCYFLWQKGYDGSCKLTNHHYGSVRSDHRELSEFSTIIRHPEALNIIRSVKAKELTSLEGSVSGTKPFGIRTTEKPDDDGEYDLFWKGGIGPLKAERVTRGRDIIKKWNVITSKASYDHGGQSDKNGQRRMLAKLEVLPPKTACSESYIVVGSFDSETDARNFEKYLKTKFVRFLMSVLSFSQDITSKRFSFVPAFDDYRGLDDKALYAQFNLTEEDVEFIEKTIKEMP